mmetsp:Transcript_33423/g.59805  ORF Transcript_33423/g.59805 Transcript_33423/m.59805 type:complete len:280 (+) Transcript_33423:301-1140(+)
MGDYATGYSMKRGTFARSRFARQVPGKRQSLRQKAPESAGGVVPYFLLGAVIFCGVCMPFYILFIDGIPDIALDFKPPLPHLPTRAVVDRPEESVHFFDGELVSEGRALGPHDSIRHVVEFTDFFCPHCQEAHRSTMLPLLEEFVSKGWVRVESHPVAFLENDSLRAAHAVLCAQEQHKYWELRELLFQVDLSLVKEGETVFTGKLLKRLAHLAGLNLEAFATCFKSQRHVDEVHTLSKLARRMGVTSTPTFFINDKHFEGPLSRAQLLQALHLQKFVD